MAEDITWDAPKEDVSWEDPKQPPTWGQTALDVAKQLPSGIALGAEAIPGIIPSAMGAIGRGVESGIRAMGWESPEAAEEIRQREGLRAAVQKAREEGSAPPLSTVLPKPETTLGEYARSVGEFAPAAISGPGGLARRVLTQDVAPAVTSETAGQLTKGTELETPARIAGALVGGAGAMGVARGAETVATPATSVARDLGRALVRDSDTPEELFARLQQLREIRPEATVADAARENVQGLVERIAQTPGAGMSTVIPRLTERQQAQANRLVGDLSSLTGTRQSAFQATQETMAARAQAAAPLYRQAYADGDRAIWSPELERLSSSPTVRAAMQGAVRVWRDNAVADGYGAMNPGALVDRGGLLSFPSGSVPAFPNVQFWDYTKRMLDDRISSAIRAGQNQKVRTLTTLARILRGELDSQVPSYAAARQAWGGPSQYLEAIEQGRNILSRSASAEELAANLREMTEAQREGYRIGAVSAITGKMRSDPAAMANMTKYVRSPEMREKIGAMMPTPEAAENFNRRLDYEVGSAQLAGRAIAGSPTARRMSLKEDAENTIAELAMGTLTHGFTAHGLLARTLRTVAKPVRDTLRSRADAILADILVNHRVGEGTAQLIPQIDRQLSGGVRPVPQITMGMPFGAQGDQRKAGGRVDDQKKATKTEANYHGGTKDKRCGVCTMFRPPHGCTAVRGQISPHGWCKFFEHIPKRADGGKIEHDQDVVSGAVEDTKTGTVEEDRRILAKDRKHIAVHERAEAKAMARGVPYKRAHEKYGIPAERRSVERSGRSWAEYTESVAGSLSHIEHEKVCKAPRHPHVDPRKAVNA